MYFLLPKIFVLFELRDSWQCGWGLQSPGIWQCTVWSSSPIRIFFMATLTLEDSGTMLLRYVGNHLPNGTASHIQEDLNPICILFTTNFHPLYISLWLHYTGCPTRYRTRHFFNNLIIMRRSPKKDWISAMLACEVWDVAPFCWKYPIESSSLALELLKKCRVR